MISSVALIGYDGRGLAKYLCEERYELKNSLDTNIVVADSKK